MGDLVPRIYLTNIKLLPLALCGDVYEGDETDHEPEKESQSPQNLLSVTIAFIQGVRNSGKSCTRFQISSILSKISRFLGIF